MENGIMKRIFIAMFIFFSLFIFFTTTNAGELYKCIDRDNNIIITDTPQDGMKDCVLKDSSDDFSRKERAQRQKKSYKSRQESQREKAETEAEKVEEEQKEAALIREGNKCYTQALNVISGGSVSDVYYWRICKDKNGKVVSKRRL
jgi:hypothetical protein